jgi:squalene-hopene/tetraprenyl-beta-curcumene cyclase
MQALAQSGREDAKAAVANATRYILSCVHSNGAIYKEVGDDRKGGGLPTYNTAICMTALHATRNPELTRVIQNARKYVAGAQHTGDDEYKGGFGYDASTKRAYTDLLNTYYVAVAMRETQSVEDQRPAGEKRVDIDWSETVKYVARLQNKPEAGAQDSGGIFYNPNDPKAGATTNAQGVVVLRSYGSMTYAGLLALIYANVDRDDARVRSAFDWSVNHWSLAENPGMGAQGLYYFYNVLGKSLGAYGQPKLVMKDGTAVDWKAELAKKLISLQKIDAKTGQGYWVNENGRYWENNSILATGYALIALQRL